MNKILLAILLLLATGKVFGQSCANLNLPTAIAESCQNAPFLCGNFLENYCGTNAGLTDDAFGLSSGFLRLSPCEGDIKLQVSVSNCASGSTGLIFRLYPNGCNPNTALSSDTIYQNTTDTLVINNLDALENYLLAISGVQGSQCEFNIQVVEGIGTALPGPVSCTCQVDSIQGVNHLWTKDTFIYSIDMPNCFLGFGSPIGGNGEYCPPAGVCPAFLDSIIIHWHIPSVMHFIGDSTGLSIMVQIDSNYFGLDTFRNDTIWASWQLISKEPVDPISFCECSSITCANDSGNIIIKPIVIGQIPNQGISFSCTLTCTQPTCEINGVIYNAPGVYFDQLDDGTLITVTIYEEDATPIMQSQIICEGGTALLKVLNITPDYTYQWSTGEFGTSISVSPDATAQYSVTATHSSGNCQYASDVSVTVLPNTQTNFGQVGTITCSQSCVLFQGTNYCQPGTYTVQNGQCSTQTFSIGSDLSLTQTTLPPVTICEGDCHNFFGQQICTSMTATHVENCTNFTQQITVEQAGTTNLGIIGTINCSQPCYNYQGLDYCQPGVYTVQNNTCGSKVFEIVFEKETINLGEVGKITCAQNCVNYEGIDYCQGGNYTLSDNCTIRNFSIGEDTDPPLCSDPSRDCLPSNTHFTVAFSISGQPPFKVDGAPITGNYFLSGPLANGVPYAFIVEQPNGCQSVVNGLYDCAQLCPTDAGKLSDQTVHACAGQSSVEVQSLASPLLAPGDVQDFTLQTEDGLILARNTTGNFSFDPTTMTLEETYFLIRNVGPPDNFGFPDPANACTDTSSRQPVIFHALPSVALSGDSSLCEGNTLIITASGAQTYLWNDGFTGAVKEIQLVNPANSGLYSALGADKYGCTDEDSTTILVRPQQSEGCCRPQLPNAFTPNGDGANDTFIPILPDCNKLEFAEMRVYSRWGELVFKSIDDDDRWDGTTPSGTPASSDTYVFTFRYRLEGDEEKTQKGEVTLLR